ncbi:MAG: CheR-type methyltransferase [Myxococcaceae bacterium]|nr:CheR-type methyltransferase [Myxococcaceae bacterium]
MNKQSLVYRSARAVYRFFRSELYFGVVHLPIGRAKHKAVLAKSVRNDSHTYTCFYRSPMQMEALVGPVVEGLQRKGVRALTIHVFAGSNGGEAYTIASELLHRRPELEFTIRASDLHPHMVEQAGRASYTLQEITQGVSVPEEFIARTFDRDGDRYVVRPHIKQRVSFEQADLLSEQLPQQFPPADLVFAQNVLFHLPPPLARQAFGNILRVLKPHARIFLDGMELDMRVELTQRAGLKPLDYKVRQIYGYSRRHIPENWWDYYYGNEPYSVFSTDRLARYCTIFECTGAGA